MKVYEIIEPKILTEAEKGFIRTGIDKLLTALMDKISGESAETRATRMTGAKKKMGMLKADVGLLAKAGRWSACAVPLYTYSKNMEVWNQQAAAGQISQADLEEHHQAELGTCVAQIAALVGSVLAGSGTITALSYLFYPFPIIGPFIGMIFRLLAPLALTYMAYWLNTDEGRVAIANLIGMAYIKDTGIVAEAVMTPLKNAVYHALDIKSEDEIPTAPPAGTNAKPADQPTPPASTDQKPSTEKPADQQVATPPAGNPDFEPADDVMPMAKSDSLDPNYNPLERLKRDKQGKLQLR